MVVKSTPGYVVAFSVVFEGVVALLEGVWTCFVCPTGRARGGQSKAGHISRIVLHHVTRWKKTYWFQLKIK